MREYRSLSEWLESKGNPKHFIADGEKGMKVIVYESDDTLNPHIVACTFKETEHPNGRKTFWMNSGWGIRNEYLAALKGFLNQTENKITADKYTEFEVIEWYDDVDGEYERTIDTIQALTEAHARHILRNGINSGKYPKGAWVAYYTGWQRIELDCNGRIPA